QGRDFALDLGWLLRSSVENLTELLPTRPRPSLQLQLGPDHVIAGAGVDPDAGQCSRQYKVLQRFRLFDDVVAREIVAALLEDLFQQHALLIAGEIAGVGDVGAGQIFVEKRPKILDSSVILPALIIRILVRSADDHADGI